ncbi:right-handed parallel beta-helix repeat-containing protein [Carboxylicivirga sp. RSCT41]|uniref:right-handed parallel beta-helix repeat-containing protein n=1 Tax=Carboxylicivirga agarovorans TaxID=3417570 RepID=UPI003D335DB0
MIKKLSIVFSAILMSLPLWANTYYVDAKNGSDSNNGLSPNAAIKTLERVSNLVLKSGDKVLLANGQVFNGSLELRNVRGSKDHPITVSNYSLDKSDLGILPIIDAKGYRNGLLLMNCSHFTISNLQITADAGGVPDSLVTKNDMRCGVLITCNKAAEYESVRLSGLQIKDVFYADKGVVRSKKETNSANGTQAYGWGIRLINRTNGAVLKHMTIENCHVENVGHTGIKATGGKNSIVNLKLYNNTVTQTGGPGMQMSGLLNGHVKGNTITYSGSTTDTRKWGRGSGLWTWGCSKVLIEHNTFRFANGPADSAGCHIDFNCDNVIVQYNVSEGNAGGFCEILGNNYNCAYRYNISINDGHRVKKVNGAFQEGKIFWLSGFNGKHKKHNGPFNSYFYNNTIYVKADIVAKMAVTRTAQGVLLANNIFYIEGESKLVMGDQYKPASKGESLIKNVIFKNNLFLNADNWPEDVLIQDEAPVIGDPQFTNVTGNTAEDFIPRHKHLLKDKGIQIVNIPDDKDGLFTGLKVEKDILGNKINGLPDMGAIEIE